MHALYQSITGHVYILHGISACFVLSKINVFQSCHAIRKLVSPENMIRPDILNKHHNSFTLIVHHLFGCSWTDHDKECPTHTKCKSPLTSPAVVGQTLTAEEPSSSQQLSLKSQLSLLLTHFTEQPRLEGTSKDHQLQPFYGKGT